MKLFLATLCLWSLCFCALAQKTNVFPDSGNVGIGRTSPSHLLEVYSAGRRFSVHQDGVAQWNEDSFGGVLTWDTNTAIVGSNVATPNLSLRPAGVNVMTLQSNGRVGIGTATPGATFGELLSINGSANILSGNVFYFSNPNHTNAAGIRATSTSSATAADLNLFGGAGMGTGLFIQNEGNVGIGTTTPKTISEIKRTFPSGSQGIDFLRLTSSQAGAWFSQLGLQFRWEDTGNEVAYNLAQITATPYWPSGTQSGGHLQFWTKSLDPSSESPLSEKMRITEAGNVGIGTTDTKGYRLAVSGKIRAQEIKVEASPWPDYVFAKSYELPTLQETEKHIKEKGHLPGIPSAEEVKANGIDLGEMNAKLLQKIEELTLHMIEQNKSIQLQNEKFEAKIAAQEREIKALKARNYEKKL